MTYYDLTAYEKVRLSKSNICPICGREIYYDEDLIFDKRRTGRKVVYIFFHKDCMEEKYGKEKKVEEYIKEARANFSEIISCRREAPSAFA